jgi:hypothetical protein
MCCWLPKDIGCNPCGHSAGQKYPIKHYRLLVMLALPSPCPYFYVGIPVILQMFYLNSSKVFLGSWLMLLYFPISVFWHTLLFCLHISYSSAHLCCWYLHACVSYPTSYRSGPETLHSVRWLPWWILWRICADIPESFKGEKYEIIVLRL